MRKAAATMVLLGALSGCSEEEKIHTPVAPDDGNPMQIEGASAQDNLNLTCLETAATLGYTNAFIERECGGIVKEIKAALAEEHPQAAIVAIRKRIEQSNGFEESLVRWEASTIDSNYSDTQMRTFLTPYGKKHLSRKKGKTWTFERPGRH